MNGQIWMGPKLENLWNKHCVEMFKRLNFIIVRAFIWLPKNTSVRMGIVVKKL